MTNSFQKPLDKRKSDFCTPTPHRYWVAEVVGIPAEGTVFVLLACTDCGDVKSERIQVSKPDQQIRLMQEEKSKAKL